MLGVAAITAPSVVEAVPLLARICLLCCAGLRRRKQLGACAEKVQSSAA